jgi:hypothetical protein
MEKSPRGIELGRFRCQRSARPSQPPHAGLSLPLGLPGGRLLNQNRCPPVRHVTRRKADHPNVNYPFSLEHPSFVDVVCDDAATIYTQYSTQWDAFAHVGQNFDADGDCIPEPVYYNGFRRGIDVVGPDATGSPATMT